MKSSEGDFKIVGKGLRPHSKLTTILPDGRKITEFVEDSQFKEFIEEKKAQLKKKYSISSERYYEEKPAGEYYKIQNSLSNEEFDIGFGGEDFFRSVIKIAVNFYIKLGYEIEWVQRAISVIRKEAPNEMAYFFYVRPERYEIHNLGENEVSHIIHLRGDKSKRVLYAYVELFNMQNVLIRLNSDYQGPDINKTYAIDLKTGEEMQKDVNIILGRHHFEILHLIGRDNMKEKEARYRRVEKLIEKMQLRE
ncbi:hypothetical protein [Mucilaginibacter sp. SJ]|uniref:hypothetical protein n=1 Tax=Mucilaginibacter sp. SJ TaxID=3029053 RepID=UPI0023A9B5EA|nr:hypothetical protein [Mucilaginibacter sp. SJ]WEA01817.1 hypothetical protein MusilaSJ_02625 [Mucilaginibacter sp. SJ]